MTYGQQDMSGQDMTELYIDIQDCTVIFSITMTSDTILLVKSYDRWDACRISGLNG